MKFVLQRLFLIWITLSTMACTTISHYESYRVDKERFNSVAKVCSQNMEQGDTVQLQSSKHDLSVAVRYWDIADWGGILFVPFLPTGPVLKAMWQRQIEIAYTFPELNPPDIKQWELSIDDSTWIKAVSEKPATCKNQICQQNLIFTLNKEAKFLPANLTLRFNSAKSELQIPFVHQASEKKYYPIVGERIGDRVSICN